MSGKGIGVIDIGALRQLHSYIYNALLETNPIGVADANPDYTDEVAEYAMTVFGIEELLNKLDTVSIAVLTAYPIEMAGKYIEDGVNIMMEKPIVGDPEDGKSIQASSISDQRHLLLSRSVDRGYPLSQPKGWPGSKIKYFMQLSKDTAKNIRNSSQASQGGPWQN